MHVVGCHHEKVKKNAAVALKSTTQDTQNEFVEFFRGTQEQSSLNRTNGDLEGRVWILHVSKASSHDEL